jgi:hypothetical protein
MSARAEHTPTPWTASEDSVFAKRHCLAICDTDIYPPAENRANAAFIARACNSHEELVAAAAAILDGYAGMDEFLNEERGDQELRNVWGIRKDHLLALRAALAKAEAA